MLRPRPLPPLLLDSSPCTNRSSSSSTGIFSCCCDIFLKLTTALPFSVLASRYALVPGMPCLHMFCSKFSTTRHSSLPSALTYISSSGIFTTGVMFTASMRSPYSAEDWRSSSEIFTRSMFTFRAPDEAFDASIRSSVSFLSFLLWRAMVSIYSFAFSSCMSSFCSRSMYVTMEVSGVFRSWLTFVISSVLNRSLFMRSFTAMAMPRPMLLRFSPCSRNSRFMSEVSTQ